MRAGTTNRSSLPVRSFRRTQRQLTTTRPYTLSHLQNLTSVLPSGLMVSGPAHIRRSRSPLKLLSTGELWNVPFVFLYVWFPSFDAHKIYELPFLLISFRLSQFDTFLFPHTKSPPRSHFRHPTRLRNARSPCVCGRAQYYPANINSSRCCDQAICTECFVQIKRSEPTTTHLVSEPAACPYCVQEHFGVVYTPPPWRTGIGSDGSVGLLPVQSLHVGLGNSDTYLSVPSVMAGFP